MGEFLVAREGLGFLIVFGGHFHVRFGYDEYSNSLYNSLCYV
jgi:hypothetical protein